ncbi:MAG: hypothetical protein ACK5S6_04395, partial [bacterium]
MKLTPRRAASELRTKTILTGSANGGWRIFLFDVVAKPSSPIQIDSSMISEGRPADQRLGDYATGLRSQQLPQLYSSM